MKEKIYNELLVHVPLCTHKDPKKVLIISDNAMGILDEIKKYRTIETQAIAEDIDMLRDLKENTFDVVISEMSPNNTPIAHINRVLKDDGLAVWNNFDLKDTDATIQKFKAITQYFKIAMPYSMLSHSKAVLASKEYHPTADINLQRADLTDGFEVYNSDLHIALFAMPTYIKKTYLGIIKN